VNRLWNVVLAAGAGRRLESVTRGVPKQFWRGPTGVSLLDQTLARFALVTPPSRTVVVIDETHRQFVDDGSGAHAPTFVAQPCDRGTATGVLLGLTAIADADPDAIVTITPSDHGVVDDRVLHGGLAASVRHVRQTGSVVVFGAQPAAPCTDYGWLMPGARIPQSSLHTVTSFVEKPPAGTAAHLFASGAVWNTMVVVARAEAIWNLYADLRPDVWRVFSTARDLPAARRPAFLASAYQALPAVDFSRDVLTHAPALATWILPASAGWTDLGTPDRLRTWHLHVQAAVDATGGAERRHRPSPSAA